MILPTPNGKVHMINLRGRVVEVESWEVDDKRKLGWKIVVNPRQSYYFEYDQSAGGIQAPENLLENIEEADVLPGQYI